MGFYSLLGSVGRAIPLPRSVFPLSVPFLLTAAALYLNEQSTTIIVARQGVLVSFDFLLCVRSLSVGVPRFYSFCTSPSLTVYRSRPT